jgi:hypothetical protein
LKKVRRSGEGLLKGGSSWSNIFSGGAAPEESNFCVAHVGFGDAWRAGRILNILVFLLMQLPAMLRISCLVLLERLIGLPEAARGILKGQWFSQELGMVLSRMCVGVALREIVTIGGKVDVTRGLPVVHLNFLGYDELAHRRSRAHGSPTGPQRNRPRDQRSLSCCHRSQRRDYHVWIFSDHGQEDTHSFATEHPGDKDGRSRMRGDDVCTHAAWRLDQMGIRFHSCSAMRAAAEGAANGRISVERGKSFSIARRALSAISTLSNRSMTRRSRPRSQAR